MIDCSPPTFVHSISILSKCSLISSFVYVGNRQNIPNVNNLFWFQIFTFAILGSPNELKDNLPSLQQNLIPAPTCLFKISHFKCPSWHHSHLSHLSTYFPSENITTNTKRMQQTRLTRKKHQFSVRRVSMKLLKIWESFQWNCYVHHKVWRN